MANWWDNDPLATAADATVYGGNGRAATSPQDRKVLSEASAKAQMERDASRDYDVTERAVRTMGTGPAKAAFLDAMTFSEDGGILDTIGGIIGHVPRALGIIDDETMDARDTLNTVAARNITRGQTLPPGPASDRDVALARTAGVTPYKGIRENLRIIEAARRDSGLEQARALLKSKWIAKFGSLTLLAASRFVRGGAIPSGICVPRLRVNCACGEGKGREKTCGADGRPWTLSVGGPAARRKEVAA